MGQDLGTVLRAVAQLNGQGDLHVRIVGGGKALPQFKKLSTDLALSQVEFCPAVPLYELPALLASGDIHVICQKLGTEGLLVPSKIYGTLAVGRPALFIGPGDCEVGHIVRESRCGFIVKPGDVESAARALRRLAGEADLRQQMGDRAKRYYAEHCGRARSVARIAAIIEECRNGNHAEGGNQGSRNPAKAGHGVTRESGTQVGLVRSIIARLRRLWHAMHGHA